MPWHNGFPKLCDNCLRQWCPNLYSFYCTAMIREFLDLAAPPKSPPLLYAAPIARTPEFRQQLKRANLSLIPTLTLFDVEGCKQNIPEQRLKPCIAQMLDQLRA